MTDGAGEEKAEDLIGVKFLDSLGGNRHTGLPLCEERTEKWPEDKPTKRPYRESAPR